MAFRSDDKDGGPAEKTRCSKPSVYKILPCFTAPKERADDDGVCAAETARRSKQSTDKIPACFTALNEIADDHCTCAVETERWRKQSIYKIPVCFTAQKEKFYKPQVVSIGPYHHGTDCLEAMEKHKLRARHHFLLRSGCESLQWLCEELDPVAQDLKDAYDQLDGKWQDTEAFLKLMITDGCFILELLRTAAGQTGEASNYGYSDNDPIFSKHGKRNIVPYLMRDMLLLENQIPMAVLQTLYSTIPDKNDIKEELATHILEFFQTIELKNIHDPRKRKKVALENLNNPSECMHILDLYRKRLIFDPRKEQSKEQIFSKSVSCCPKIGDGSTNKSHDGKIIRSVTELKAAGITFKRSKTNSLRDISFKRVFHGFFGGLLKLPFIKLDDTFESLYLNLIAFERFHVGAGSEVTSYIFFMDSIIENIQDVSLLHSGGVLQNALGSDEAVAKLFNTLSTNSVLNEEDYLAEVHKDVSIYCEKKWHRWRRYCLRTYFHNPWISVTVFAAVFIFFLTIVQTVYAILTFHRSSSQQP